MSASNSPTTSRKPFFRAARRPLTFQETNLIAVAACSMRLTSLGTRRGVTPMRGHWAAMTHRSQWGRCGLQVPWPKATRSALIRIQYGRGNFSRKAFSVSSGVVVCT